MVSKNKVEGQLSEKQRHNLKVAVMIFVGLLVVYFIIGQLTKIGKIPIDVKYAPFDAKVLLDGKELKNNRINYLKLGEHRLVVERQGFEGVEKDIVIREDDKYLLGGMLSAGPAGRDYALAKSKDFMTVEGISGELAMKAGDDEREAYPILKHLPIKNTLFSIGDTYDGNGDFVVIVKSNSQAYLGAAIRELFRLSSDVDPTEYKIVIEDFSNPFGGNRE
jgi:hypothetical protein